MKFRIWTIFWAFALLASAMATFGMWGILWTLFVASFWGVAFSQIRMTLFGWFLGVVFILFLIALLLPAVSSAREAARRNRCLSNIKQIALALHFYADKHGSFPPAYSVDANGKPLHSWRVLILPYLEHTNLYQAINLDEPWDSTNNRKLWDLMPEVYRCPSCEHACKLGAISCPPSSPNYFAVVGPQTCWPGSSSIKLPEITDGTSSTILFIDTVMPNTCWMEPLDLTTEEAMAVLCGEKQPGHLSVSAGFFSTSITSYYCQTAFADGHGKAIYGKIDEQIAAALLTRNGNESFDAADEGFRREYQVHQIAKVYHWKRIYSFAMFLLLSVVPFVNLHRRQLCDSSRNTVDETSSRNSPTDTSSQSS